jgi:acetyltransferase
MSVPDYHDMLEVDGTRVTIRTMRPTDRDIEARFVAELSPTSRYYRFHSVLKALDDAMLERFTHVNYPQDMALIATIPEGAGEREIGVARYARYPDSDRAEIAIVVADEWQGKGIGARLLLDLRSVAISAGVRQFDASVLPGNTRMLELARSLGFKIREAGSGGDPALELGKKFEG